MNCEKPASAFPTPNGLGAQTVKLSLACRLFFKRRLGEKPESLPSDSKEYP
jgi:hypothetical protein